MANVIAGGTEWTTHRVSGYHGPSQLHLLGHVLKGADVDGAGRYPGCLDRPGDMPDRHVANRSHRNEEHEIDLLIGQKLRPLGARFLDEALLGRGAGE